MRLTLYTNLRPYYKKITKDISSECSRLCSLNNPSILRDSPPEALKSFEESHVREIHDRGPILAAMVEAASIPKMNERHSVC